MAEVQPFPGWRYDVEQIGDLSDVTAPPYDVIDAEEQTRLYERHPCNVVRLILNRDEPGDADSAARYQRAADFLKRWQDEGVLKQDSDECVYVYHQVFDWEGTHYVRRGFLARLRLEEFGEGSVFPHEQTMSGPKADRLALTHACQMNFSAIFGLYADPQAAAQSALEEAIAGQAPLEATDDLGVIHRLWPVSDPAVAEQVRSGLKDNSIFIADGHHRYETAVNYRNELKSAGKITSDDDPANFVMMMFVGMSDPGLAILPTHRLVSGLPDLTADDLKEALRSHFSVEEVGEGDAGAQRAWELMEADGGQEIFGLGTAADGKWLLARLTDAGPMQTLAPEQSEAWRHLGVSLLHKLVIEHLLCFKYPDAQPKCQYVHLLREVTRSQAERSAPLACLVAPAGIEHVREIASKFEKMPPKSTFFYPKLLTGLVFNPLQ